MKTSVILGADHAGFLLKSRLCESLCPEKYSLLDVGAHCKESCDYPLYAHKLAKYMEQEIKHERHPFGILICGTGVGMSIVANRYDCIRAACVSCSEVAVLARKHNNANVLALGARFLSYEDAMIIVDSFLTTAFQEGRHGKRIEKINVIR